MDAQINDAMREPVYDLPGHIRQTYRRMALVSGPQQIDRIAGDDDTLIVSCDWLLWQQAVADGRHCVHYEQGLSMWTEPDSLDSDLMIAANSWIYLSGRDLTLFKGVSLGKLFHSEALFCKINIIRLERALIRLIERFQPESLHFFDFANDINVLDKGMRRRLVESIAIDKDIAFLDESQDSDTAAGSIAESLVAEPAAQPAMRRLAGTLYGTTLSVLSTARTWFTGKRRIMLLLGGNTIDPLLREFEPSNITPIVQARTIPKRVGAILGCLRKGILLFDSPELSLDRASKDRLQAIRDDLRNALANPRDPHEQIFFRFIETYLIEGPRLERLAREVLRAEKVIDRFRPERIVVDGVRNPPPRIYIELAQTRGCAIDYLWHSPMVPQYLKFDALGGDPNTAPMVSRCLSWGPMNEEWLDSVGAEMPRVRVGSPLSDKYSGWKGQKIEPADAPLENKNILVLQYAPILSDLKSLNSNLYYCFVALVQHLKKAGCKNIRFKLHPGPGRWKKNYFENIADFFELDCEILKTEPYKGCVDWADVIIGPAQTGAFFETLAAGKPYYPYILKPHSYDISCYDGFHIYSSLSEVVSAVQDQEIERSDGAAGARLLDRLYSTQEFPSGSARLWQVLNEEVTS